MSSLHVSFTRFKALEETVKNIICPDTLPFEKLDLNVFEWLAFRWFWNAACSFSAEYENSLY